MDNKEDEDNDFDTTQSIASTCIDTFGDRFKNICAEVVDVADELLTTIVNTPDAIYDLSLMYSSQEESRDNDLVEDLVLQDLSKVNIKVEDSVYQDLSLGDQDSRVSSQVETKIESPISQISSQVNTTDAIYELSLMYSSQEENRDNDLVEDLVLQDKVNIKVEDSVYQDLNLGKINTEGLDYRVSSQVETKIENPISQIPNQVNSSIQLGVDVSLKLEDNNEVNSSYSSQNESSFSSLSRKFRNDSFHYSGKTASASLSSSTKSFDQDFFWVDKEIGNNAYEASSTDNVLIHKKEVNMVSKLKSLKIDNDKIDMNTMRKKEFKSTHLEDGWDDNLIHDDELESFASEKSNKKSTTYKKKMKSVITPPKFIISKKKSSYVNGEEQIDHRHHQTPLPIKDCSIDSDWEVL
ncbi:hypothetical protein ZOSMA_14G00680 [Zostera marina]|uniref:Uncharacterized protein n=1 Tax=Zostera marina TaxID=29655 RepID=A0A0K9PYJ8_ZOSMR|nr:hypothetical protein ZOSMA_14G00680 [Zostera marina]